MKRRLLIALSGLALALLLSGCFIIGVFIDPTEGITVLIGSDTYLHEATYDFGPADPSAAPVTATAELANISSFDLTVTAVAVDLEVFAVQTPELPFTLARGDTVEISVSFEPVDASAAAGTITVQVERSDSVFLLNLTGEGNFPPQAFDAVVVSGAGTSGANGIYLHDGFLNDDFGEPISYYEKADAVHRVFGAGGDGVFWNLGTTTEPSDALYNISANSVFGPTSDPLGDQWFTSLGLDPPPESIGPFDLPNPSYFQVGDIITVNYHYTDPDGDPEGGTTFRWFRSDGDNPEGPYSEIDLSDPAATYETTIDDAFAYLKVEVTPRSSEGVAQGEPVTIGPTPYVYSMIMD